MRSCASARSRPSCTSASTLAPKSKTWLCCSRCSSMTSMCSRYGFLSCVCPRPTYLTKRSTSKNNNFSRTFSACKLQTQRSNRKRARNRTSSQVWRRYAHVPCTHITLGFICVADGPVTRGGATAARSADKVFPASIAGSGAGAVGVIIRDPCSYETVVHFAPAPVETVDCTFGRNRSTVSVWRGRVAGFV